MKALLKKLKEDGWDFYLNPLHLRNTTRDQTSGSPAQRLMSRRTRTNIPTTSALLKPAAVQIQTWRVPPSTEVLLWSPNETLNNKLWPGDAVKIQTPSGWKPAELKGLAQRPRSYAVTSGPRAHTNIPKPEYATPNKWTTTPGETNAYTSQPGSISPRQTATKMQRYPAKSTNP